MVQIANVSYNPLNFTQKDGVVVEILPGEAAAVDIDKDNINVTARESAGLVVVDGTEKQAAKAARESPAAPVQQQTESPKTEVPKTRAGDV